MNPSTNFDLFDLPPDWYTSDDEPAWVLIFKKGHLPADLEMFEKPLQKAISAARTVGRESKPLALYPANWPEELDWLDRNFPNFVEATRVLRRSYACSRMSDSRVEFPPILLDGPPGVGKTEYVTTLARLLGVDMHKIDMACAQTNGTLCGLDNLYSNAQPGVLFNKLVHGRHANPLFMLDELDKASQGDAGHSKPTTPLLSLLEPGSAATFCDLALPTVPLNASHVLWLATSNDLRQISAPLLSRFEVVSVQAPTFEQGLTLASILYTAVLESKRLTHAMAAELPQAVAEHLARTPPRQVRRLLAAACGQALLHKRDCLQLEDIPKALPDDAHGHGSAYSQSSPRAVPFGFAPPSSGRAPASARSA